MSDDVDRALQAFRDVEPTGMSPVDMQPRIEASVQSRRRARRVVGAASVVGAAALVLVVSQHTEIAVDTGVAVLEARNAEIAGSAIHVGDDVPREHIVVMDGGRVRLRDERGVEASADGPASFQMAQTSVVVSSGRVLVTGTTRVEGCGCDAHLDGEAAVDASDPTQLVVRVFAGSVSRAQPTSACRIVDLNAPITDLNGPITATAVEAPQAQQEIPDTPEASLGSEETDLELAPRPRPRNCDVGAQAADYRRALSAATPRESVRLLRQARRDHPRCPLAHEVDVAIIEGLTRAGDQRALRREARRFVRRYPNSPRRAEVRALLD